MTNAKYRVMLEGLRTIFLTTPAAEVLKKPQYAHMLQKIS